MKYILFLCLISVLAAMLWTWQLEGNAQNAALERAKNAVNRAAHDASLQINDVESGNGRLIFDQVAATQAFTETLRKNMQLDVSLNAIDNTLYKGKVEIVFQDFIDDGNVVSRFGTEFNGVGKLYQYTSPEFSFSLQQMIYGPAVVYVIKVPKPIQINDNNDTFYYVGSIYEYPLK